ncbi:MAG: PhnD/SsuA/transferrin family substrate-binding protein [Planctomycetota bacterium]|nr:PhnD/SsuA/transferrin family substrate-binding protein [Planctomycetota bacterium]
MKLSSTQPAGTAKSPSAAARRGRGSAAAIWWGLALTAVLLSVAVVFRGGEDPPRDASPEVQAQTTAMGQSEVRDAAPTVDRKGQLDPAAPLPEELSLVFGVYQSDRATELYRMFLPVLELLQDDLSQRLARKVNIELRIFSTYEEGIDALVQGDVDFARFGPSSYVLSKQREPGLELLAKESKKGASTFKGVICVRQDSSYQKLEDLRGASFAFGNPDSTIGRYLSQAEFLKVGIRARDLKEFAYLQQHDKVAMAVMLGDFDAGALKESTFEKMNTGGELRRLHDFDNVTKPWVARAGLHGELAAALRACLIEASDEAALANLKVTGFLEAEHGDYAVVEKAMARALADFDPEGLDH